MSAQQSNPTEIYEKGLDYLFGEGLAKNLVKARECFEEAASNGSARAYALTGPNLVHIEW